MRILLISPVIGNEMRREKGLLWPSLALYILEGLTPPGHIVRVIEEELESVPSREEFDLVGISCMTANAPRAYRIADSFKARGITVVMGGIHPTVLPDEALDHADSVIIGEAEGIWVTVLDDFMSGRLQRKYHDPHPDLGKYVPKNFTGMIRKPFNILPVITTRGCPYDCDFCSVSKIFGKKITHIPIENIMKDLVDSHCKRVLFYDDNIISQPRYSNELFRSIKPLKIKWAGQSTLSLIEDEELMRSARESGCMGLLIGLESISEPQMRSMKKSLGDRERLKKALKNVMKLGILVHATMIFGFDTDSVEIFEETVRFLIECKISTVSFCILTPLPGTRIYDKFLQEGRLITKDWQYFNNRTVVFMPRNMSPYELQSGNLKAKKDFYCLNSILKRTTGNMQHFVFHLASNFTYIKHVRNEQERLRILEKELFRSIIARS